MHRFASPISAVLFAYGIACAQTQSAPPFRSEPFESPQIIQLREVIQAGEAGAVSRFWEKVRTAGTPLIESKSGDDQYSLVTFLWRGANDLRNVAVIDGVAGGVSDGDPAKMLMTRLADTDVWYRTYAVRNDARFHYWISPNDDLRSLLDPNRTSQSQIDPLNPHRAWPMGPSYLELSAASPQPFIEYNPANPSGKLEQTRFKSSLLANERDVWVYTPPGFDSSAKAYPLLIVMDGRAYTSLVPVPVILDNLIAAKRVPPLVAVFIGNVNRDTELACSPVFADFLAKEVVPWSRANYHTTLNPNETIVAGSSLGGLAATFAGLRHSEVFGKILSQSASFWWKPETDLEPEWLTRQFAQVPHLPLKLFVEAGEMEIQLQLDTNRHMRDILTARGYQFRYKEFNGNHSYVNWRGTFADGLLYLMSGTH